ncbi:MAG TPA: deoxynucleoside kinase [Symbiobacteriaceae bacterium]|nr:deoxynucleoside kinase [Symbiobacteriaceae bacterium]
MFITIEGVIGVGKTTVTRLLTEALRGETLFEIVEENPFLKDFYTDRDAWALQTETFFLLNRVKQLEDTAKRLATGATVVSDYNVIKNRIFAGLTLTGSKREKYVQLFDILTGDLPHADVIVYLKANHDTVMERIHRRDRPFERNMDPHYIRRLADEYEVYFAEPERYFGKASVLVVDTTKLDLVGSEADKQSFIDMVNRTVHQAACAWTA